MEIRAPALLLLLAVSLAWAAPLGANTWSPAAGDRSPDELEQLVAPVALYPDALLSQVLMAATYPLEIVQAARWLDDHPDLSDRARDEALQDEDWDPSVKSLCGYPDTLSMLSDNLDWAQELGDALLDQQQDVLEAVQRMRALAQEAGSLETGGPAQVDEDDGAITVEDDEDDDVVYVPIYSACAVYGAWTCDRLRYPTLYDPPGRAGVEWRARRGQQAWGALDWGAGALHVDVQRYNAFTRRTCVGAKRLTVDRAGGRARWNHDPEHRRGVNYRSSTTARRYAPKTPRTHVEASRARGRPSTSADELREGLARGSATSRTHVARVSASGRSSSALSGAHDAHFERSASERGSRSRSASRGRVGGRR